MEQPLASLEIRAGTVRELWESLGKLLGRHGNTRIATVDGEVGLEQINAITMWDTSKDIETGCWDVPLTLILHSGTYLREMCQNGPELITDIV